MKGYLKALPAIILLLVSLNASSAGIRDRQRDTTKYSDSYLDTVKVERIYSLNDYMLIGFEAGSGVNRMMFNPSYNQTWRRFPEHFELTFIKYNTFLGFKVCGMKLGVAYSHEGYRMQANEETGYIGSISGATECQYDILEVPFLAHIHFLDTPNFRTFIDIGPYAAYRMNIERYGNGVSDDIRNSFLDSDIRFDYGIRAGAGFALIFDPVELHIGAKCRYSFSNLYHPDYASEYYYSYAYPLDIMVTAGLFFQLSKKTGKTKSELKKEAYRIVFGDN